MHNEVYNEAHARHATHEQIGAAESIFQLAFTKYFRQEECDIDHEVP
jgi:hypothetical protein